MRGAGQERGLRRSETRAAGFSGHLRVRKATAEEMEELARLFSEPDRSRWVRETVAGGRARVLVMERFVMPMWAPLGVTVTAADGETALALHPEGRCCDLAREVLRAAVRVLRDEPFTALSACIDPGDARAARVFQKAGFAPSGSHRVRGRLWARYIRNLRGDYTPYNVWI